MREPIAQFDPHRFIALLHDHRIDYVMVGGFAGRVHDAARRRDRRLPARPVDRDGVVTQLVDSGGAAVVLVAQPQVQMRQTRELGRTHRGRHLGRQSAGLDGEVFGASWRTGRSTSPVPPRAGASVVTSTALS